MSYLISLDLAGPNLRRIKRLLAGSVFIFFLSIQALSQPHSAFPVDITAGPLPQPLMANGRSCLIYELHITNFSASPIELLALEVFGGNGTVPLASYRSETLEKLLFVVGSADSAHNVRSIGGGRSAVIFLDLILDSGTNPPAVLVHRLSLSISRRKDGSGGTIANVINGPVITVIQESAPRLRAPLRGSSWVAFNALFNENHRRAFNPVDGKERIAERFAIDWMRLGPDGRLFHGDSGINANFYSYGEEVIAVADGRISDLKDDLAENVGSNEISNRKVTLDNIVGNYLIVDLGKGCFALYAHLQPHSFRIKLGDNVKAGEVLALLGNSGNSDAPHLHFQLMNANSPLAAEGIPYELEAFTQLGVLDLPDALDGGQAWRPKSQEKPVEHRLEFPVNNSVLIFP
jgi:murein DD-endopeptidase